MITERRFKASWTIGRGRPRAFGWLIGGFFALVAAIVTLVLGVAFFIFAMVTAITLMIRTIMASGRGAVRRATDPALIEARRVDGHSWVAYGGDERR